MAAPCTIGRGVRQGCLLSPLLFNIYAKAMMKEAMDEIEEGVKFGGHQIQTARFADDQAMTAMYITKEGSQIIMNNLNDVVESFKKILINPKLSIGMKNSGNISQNAQKLKKRLIKTLVWSVLYYMQGSELEIKPLESCEMWIWRRMERISWRDRVRNEEVLRRADEERVFI